MSKPGRPKRDAMSIAERAADLWAQECHEIGYLARVFTQTSLPYRNPGDELPAWVRHNGNQTAGLTLTLQPGPPSLDPVTGQFMPVGYPYGTIPRLLLTWLSTEAVRTKERVIPLGDSLSDFMRQLDLGITGGKTGTISKLRDQTRRLFQARIVVEYREKGSAYGYEREAFKQLTVADNYDLWWSNRMPDQATLMPSYVELSDKFFQEVTTRPVPLSVDALRQLRGSPMRLDIYAWLTHRMSYLSKPSNVPWESLLMQFGSNAQSRWGRQKFRADFIGHLRQVLAVYFDASVTETKSGLLLSHSASHVRRGERPALRSTPHSTP